MEFNLSNNITVTNQQSTIVTITTTGPQGPIGPIGNSGSDGAPGPPGSIDFDWYDGNSYISTSKDVYITGSLTVSGSNTFNNIGPANFTTISASSYISASEFSGDGTSLILKSGIVSSSLQFNNVNSPFTGSFTGSFTGNINSASYAVTSSYALNSSGTGIFNQTGSFYNTTNNVGITGSFVVTGGITGSNSISAIYDLFGVTRSLAEQGGDVIKWDPSLQKYTNGPLVLFSGFNVSSSDPAGVVGFESLTLTNDDTINFIGASGSKNGSVLDIKFDTGFDRIDGQRVQANRVIRYMSGSLNPPSIKASPDQVSLTVTSEEYQIASASVKYGLPAINVNSNGKRFTFYQLMDGESIQITQSATATGLIETVGKYKIDVFICNTTPSYYLITSESLSVF